MATIDFYTTEPRRPAHTNAGRRIFKQLQDPIASQRWLGNARVGTTYGTTRGL